MKEKNLKCLLWNPAGQNWEEEWKKYIYLWKKNIFVPNYKSFSYICHPVIKRLLLGFKYHNESWYLVNEWCCIHRLKYANTIIE